MSLSRYHLAQANFARAVAPLDGPEMADFMNALDRINGLAEASPGFVWRLQDDSGNATGIKIDDDPLLIPNLSVWESREALFDFTYKSDHTAFLARRREWFQKPSGPYLVLWWVTAGHRPGLLEALARLNLLADRGPGPEAFTFKQWFPAPDQVQVAE